MSTDTVSFLLPGHTAQGLDVAGIDPDCDRGRFGTGVSIWILQTFLRLRAVGARVDLVETPPASGLVVAHADHVEGLLCDASSPAKLVVVSVRADRRPQSLADVEIVQNASSVRRNEIFIPSWLQPGLVRRDSARGRRVEVVAYMGNRQQLHHELAATAWADLLATRGLHWDNRMVSFLGNDQPHTEHRWHDYSDVDVIVALRPGSTRDVWSKPAAKLQNAWAAGVPAILGPEAAYRELRRSRLDYLEVESGADALKALDSLRTNPDLYEAMAQNGLERAAAFHPDRLTARWTEVLWGEAPVRASARRHRLIAKTRMYRAALRGLAGGRDRQGRR